jgi:hypothetical protein
MVRQLKCHGGLGEWALLSAVWLLGFALQLIMLRRQLRRVDRSDPARFATARLAAAYLLVWSGILISFPLLVWIGVAAGIH